MSKCDFLSYRTNKRNESCSGITATIVDKIKIIIMETYVHFVNYFEGSLMINFESDDGNG